LKTVSLNLARYIYSYIYSPRERKKGKKKVIVTCRAEEMLTTFHLSSQYLLGEAEGYFCLQNMRVEKSLKHGKTLRTVEHDFLDMGKLRLPSVKHMHI